MIYFSIIVPNYNGRELIRNLLENLIKQKYRNFELVIIDGLSTDESGSVINMYRDKLKIQYLSEADSGIYDAMNKGINMAKGNWLYFMGNDDLLKDEYVLEQVANLISDDYDIVYGDSIWLPENKIESGEWTYSKLLGQNINHQRIFYRASLFNNHKAFELQYKIASDHEMNIRLFCSNTLKKKHVPLLIAYYHSGGYSANKIDEVFWDNWKQILVTNFSQHLTKKQIYLRAGWYCWYQIRKKNYSKAINIFSDIYFHTFNFNFLKHTISQTLKRF